MLYLGTLLDLYIIYYFFCVCGDRERERDRVLASENEKVQAEGMHLLEKTAI